MEEEPRADRNLRNNTSSKPYLPTDFATKAANYNQR